MFSTMMLSGCSNESGDSVQYGKSDEVAERVAENVDNTATGSSSDWPSHGFNSAEQRFSPLTQINADNISDLSLAWFKDLPEARGQEATPLVVDGVMYTSAAWSHVFALNPVSGEELWHFDPKIDKATRIKGCCGPVNRGVAYSNGKIFIGAFDGRLIALDAKTGRQIWSTQTVDTSKHYTITGAPRIANGKVFIGNGGAEFGVRGYVSAYDENTGEMVWRFYTIPNKPGEPQENEIHKETVKTWSGEFWKLGGGGTVWDSMAFDKDLNLLYIGVGNSSPWNPKLRSNGEGDNLFVSSMVALDADTGEYAWHYQTTPQDGWDYTATQHMILAELEINNKPRSVIMQAPKNGFFYVLDRATGEFISAKNYVPVNWASHIDASGRPVVNPEAKYWETGKPALVVPAWSGGHNWHPMSFSPNTGLVYLPAQEMAFPYVPDADFSVKQLAVNLGVDLAAAAFPDDANALQGIKEASKGHLSAWDPVGQQEIWRVQYPGPWNGGVLATAGDLVFQGSATGFVNAYDARTGNSLWSYPAQTGVVAPPISYQIDGEQYITVSAGWGGIFPILTGPLSQDSDPDPVNRSRLLTFKIGGIASLPEITDVARDLPDFSDVSLDQEVLKRGHNTFERYCAACHGTGAVGGGVVPDLRYSPTLGNEEGWQSIVHDGVLKSRGMVGFSRELSKQDISDLRQFVIGRNQFARSIGEVKRTSR